MITRIQWLAGLAAVCGTSVLCAAIGGVNVAPLQGGAEAGATLGSSAQAAALSMEAQLSHSVVSSDKSTTVYARYRLTAIAGDTTTERPLDVVLVIDTSGSMAGEKIGRARAAARRLVEQVPAGSRMALVSFDNSGQQRTEMREVAMGRAELERAIQTIEASGGTNLEDGFATGRAAFGDSQRKEALRRIFVVSDGHPTAGATSPQRLGELARAAAMTGTGVTTLGVGLDFNEDVLGTMAIQGEGRFHFIDGQGLSEALTQEVRGLRSAVATNVELQLRPRDGVSIEEVYGFPTSSHDARVDVSIDTMFAGASRDVLVKLRVEPRNLDARPLLRADLVYTDLPGDVVRAERYSLNAEAAPGNVTTGDQNAKVLERARVVLSARAVDTANRAWLHDDLSGARELLERTAAENAAHRAAFGGSQALTASDARIDDLLARITSAKPHSAPSRRYRKKHKAASIEIIRGDSR